MSHLFLQFKKKLYLGSRFKRETNKENEYEFTMPDSDVIIKPIYRKLPIKENNNLINPLTNNKFIRTILLIILFFSIGIFLYRKKELSL